MSGAGWRWMAVPSQAPVILLLSINFLVFSEY